LEHTDLGLTSKPGVTPVQLGKTLRQGLGTFALLGVLSWATSAGAAGAEPALLAGTWDGVDRASQARYGRIWVTQNFIQWSGSRYNPGCRVRYSVVSETAGYIYPDALATSAPTDTAVAHAESAPDLPRASDALPRYTIFRIALHKRRCIGQRSSLQFAIPNGTPDKAELITYDRSGKPVSWGVLARLPK
jgi:hypothetical protein